jgi:L-seryl-tRNA(Ser) seleniumtransferase
MKVGREEMIGMLVAVESWVKRDHAAEWKEWIARCERIAERVSAIAGVSASVAREPGASLSNRSPRVTIRWDSRVLEITGATVLRLLDDGEPRIVAGGAGGPQTDLDGDTGISITSAMMSPGDEKIVARRIVEILSATHRLRPPDPLVYPALNLSGRWNVTIQYAAGRAVHTLHLQQNGNRVEGTHQGDFLARDIAGTISADRITLASTVTERHGDALSYRFTGSVLPGGTLSGSLDLGEYLTATWTAQRG